MAYVDGFKANPEGLIDKGNRIKNIYERYMDEKAKVDEAKKRVEEAWKGADASKYIAAVGNYDEAFRDLGQIINQIGNVIYRHGERLVDSRDTIANIATKL